MPTQLWKRNKIKTLERCVKEIIDTLGYDPKDHNFRDTPKRVSKLWFEELYPTKATKKLFSTFADDCKQMVIIKNHDTWTRCPHHFERVKLTISIGYIPNGRLLGLSKPGRIADYYASGFALQETLTEQIAEGLFKALEPKGVGVHVKGIHLCMQARGLKTTGHAITTALRGCFEDDPSVKEEFLQNIR